MEDKTMKKVFGIAALLLAFVACNKVETEIQPVEKSDGIPFSATVSLGDNAATKALAESGSTITATWAEGEKVALIHNGVSDEMTVSSVSGGSATITGTITSPVDGEDVTIIYPSSAADGTTGNIKADLLYAQNGLLTGAGSISENYDARKGSSKLKVDGTATLSGSVSLTNQFAIFKFTVRGADGTTVISAKPLTITIGTQDYVITPAAATDVLYAALPAVSGEKVSFDATGSDSKTYTCSKDGVTFAAAKFYQSTLKMAEIISLSGRYPGDDELVIADGCILTDFAVGQSYKVSIADGATVTLRDVENNGKIEDHGTILEYRPGIKCLGDATIILEGNNTVTGGDQYAGIYVPGDKTLTIRGTGSLNVTGGYSAAGIGGNATGDANCGSIVISGGTVTATGGSSGAGIGLGANGGECKDITISGGTVPAKGSSGGAGIGLGASWGGCKAITISGGTVTAKGSDNAPGIGGVEGVYESITITGDVTKVTATKGSWAQYSLGIEDDYSWEYCGPITIGGTVYFHEGNFTNNDLTTSPFVYQP